MEQFSDKLVKLPAFIDSNVIAAEITADNTTLKQIYKIEEHSKVLIQESYGFINQKGIFTDTRTSKSLTKRRQDLKGKTVTTSYVILHNESRNHLSDFQFKNFDTISKMNYILVNDVLDLLNVTRKEIFQKTWGYKNATSNIWNGVVGDLTQKRAEIGGEKNFS